MAPMLHAHAISAAVLSAAMSRHSSTVTWSRRSKARSAPCPEISRCTAAARQREAQTAWCRPLEQQVIGERLERVAGQDRRADAKDGPGGRPVPAFGVAVHDVVVQ